MSHWLSLGIVLGFFIAGLLLGKIEAVRNASFIGRLVDVSLYLLLFFMGIRLGRNAEVARQLGQIGVLSITFTATTVAGTVLVLVLMCSLRGGGRESGRTGRRGRADRTETAVLPGGEVVTGAARPKTSFLQCLKEPGKLFLVVVFGFLCGRFVPLFPLFTAETVTTWFVYVLLLLVGIQLSRSAVKLKELLLRRETILLPAGTVAGTLLGGAAAALIFGLPVGKGLAVASGFGWYSLSGVIISDAGDQILGSTAFLSNILRESVALLTIPFLGTTRYAKVGIGIAGATSMDVSLPLIGKSNGAEAVPLAVAHGALLSLLVPLMVPLFFHLG